MKLPSGYYHKGGMTVESTKERILETALTLFARNGYLGTSMSDIAGALGITKAALYKHYAGKQEILDRIVERMREMDYARAIRDAGDGAGRLCGGVHAHAGREDLRLQHGTV